MCCRPQLESPKYEPCAQNGMLEWTVRAGAPKVRTLCSKWQLEHPKFEPFTQNGSWSTQNANPLLKIAPGVPKVRTLCSKWQLERPKYEPFARNGSWSAQSTKSVSKMQVVAPKVQFEIKALCFNLWVVPNYASTALLGGLAARGQRTSETYGRQMKFHPACQSST